MFKMRRTIILSLVLVMSLSLVSANVIFSATQDIYNLQDFMDLEVTIKPTQDFIGFVELNMDCERQLRNFYREYVSLGVNQQKHIETSLPLTKDFVAVLGTCKVEANLGEDNFYSPEFEVSDDITISFSTDKTNVKPDEIIFVRGNAVKKNGQKVNGFVDLFIENSGLYITSVVENGEFESDVKMPGNLGAGQYAIQAHVYEKIQQDITNQDEASIFITMAAVPKSMTIAMQTVNTDPNTNLTYKPVILDQANNEMLDVDVIVKLRNTNGKLMLEKIIASGEEDVIEIHSAATPGNWEIFVSASNSNLTATKEFGVNEVEEAIFILENNTLCVTNIGNVPYTKEIEVNIGGETRVVEIEEIRVGEEKKYRLYAPNGDYSVMVSDGFCEITGNVALTGDAIRIKDISSGLNYKYYLAIWIFLGFVVGLFIYSTASKILPQKKKYDINETKTESAPTPQQTPQPKSNEKLGNKKLSALVLPSTASPGYAEHTIVLHGDKQPSTLLALNLKTPEKKEMEMLPKVIKEIKEKIIEKKGVLYQSNSFLFGIFAPLSTKTFKNESNVINLGNEINGMLNEYNKKFKDKVDFGLAVHSGSLILEKAGEKLKFTSADNTMSFAKKVAELAKNEFLISEETIKKAGSEIRAKKETRNNINVYHFDKKVDRQDISKFIHDFLQRNKEQFKK